MKYIRQLSESTATLILAAINITIFATGANCALSSDFPTTLDEPWRIGTYMFVHSRPGHFVFNMVLLLVAGCHYERRTSSLWLISTYIAGGVFGGLLFAGATSFAHNANANLTGASAAIISIICAASIDRRSRFSIWGLPYTWIIVFLSIDSISGLFGANPGGSLAHIGGIITGIVSGWLANRRKKPAQPISHVIDKAQKSGYSSLTPEERIILFNQKSKHR